MAAGRGPQNLELPELTKQEKQRMHKALEKLTRYVTKHEQLGEDLLDMVSAHGPRATAKTGEISSKIYTSGIIHPQSRSTLATLSNEFHVNIYRHLSSRADQVSLALTCKHFAGIDATYRSRLNSNGNPKTYSKPNKLEILVRLHGWMPQGLSLCYQCLKFRPKNRAGWTTNTKISRSGLASQRAVSEGPKCPKCAEWASLQRGKETVSFKRVAERIRTIARRA